MNGAKAQELSITEKKTLQAILLHFAEEPFTTQKLEAAEPGRLTGFEAELGIERLRRRGIIETRRKSWGEVFHILSPGLLADWQKVLIPSGIEGNGAVSDQSSVMPMQDAQTGFAKTLFLFLAEAAYNGLALTQKGTLHRKDLQRLGAKIEWPEEMLEGLNIQYLHQDRMPKAVAIVYDAAFRLGLIRNGAEKVELVKDRVEEWLSRPLREMEERLLALWWEVYMPSDVWLQHGAAMIRNMPEGVWCSVKAMARLLTQAGVQANGRNEEEKIRDLEAYWLKPMAAIGLLELGGLENPGDVAVRKPPCLEEDDRWFVQPDLDVLVPPGVPYHALWHLASCAERIGGSPLDTYKITKKSWMKALDAGNDPEQLMETLERYAMHGMPEPVRMTLLEWSESCDAVVIEEVSLLRLKRSEDASFLRQDQTIAPLIAGEVEERVFLVRKQHVKRLAKELEKLGFSPRIMQEADEEEKAGKASASSASSLPESAGMVYSRRNVSLYPIEPSPEGTERWRERINKLPSAWRNSLRKYHSSTCREMLETAIDLRIAVRLDISGREVELVPKRLLQHGADWEVHGFVDGEETAVPSRDVGGAQLVIPGMEQA